MLVRGALLSACLSCILVSGTMAAEPDPNPGGRAGKGAANGLTTQSFAKQAAAGGMAEVEVSRMAAARAQNAEVKAFAKMLVDDHTKANSELKSLAQRKKIVLPKAVPANKRAVAAKLRTKSGAAFDKAYMAQMVDDHQKTINLFRNASTHQEIDSDLRDFAQKTLPTLEHHKQQADELNAKVGG